MPNSLVIKPQNDGFNAKKQDDEKYGGAY